MSTSVQTTEVAESVVDAPCPPALFRNRNYVWLWASSNISCLGDYFTLIAMPWLVLTLTKDAATLGAVMALESLPRAAFMLVSGGFTDRYSARKVLLVSRTIFMLALLALALDLWFGRLQLGHLYGFAFVFGLLTAFALPASQALLPQVIDRTQIQQGNSALMGSQQLIQLFAPVLAGLLIWGMPSMSTPAGAAIFRARRSPSRSMRWRSSLRCCCCCSFACNPSREPKRHPTRRCDLPMAFAISGAIAACALPRCT